MKIDFWVFAERCFLLLLGLVIMLMIAILLGYDPFESAVEKQLKTVYEKASAQGWVDESHEQD